MSVRPTSRTLTAPAQSPIEFKNEFVTSPAVIQANHEETMGKLLSRLDQLQAKVCSQSDPNAAKTPSSVSSVFRTKPLSTSSTHSDLHERLVFFVFSV